VRRRRRKRRKRRRRKKLISRSVGSFRFYKYLKNNC